ncbi:MAG: histidine--tRNA ligase [Candidatus Nanoarchaeia archaeon]|nr:histidine--tRNA ligase [Candidatus Nanoarchaeia archaeon]
MKIERAKGTRDFLPKEALARQSMTDKLRKVFEKYGFSPTETPILERYETLASKYAGGSEILKETFKLKDQGDRELGLRYDLTVPLCRVISSNPQLKMPFKRYQMERVFRDGPISAGRYREFYQCDVDIIGCKNMTADAELLALTKDVFKELKLKVNIKANNIKILYSILEYAGIKENKESVLLSLDKFEKIGEKGVIEELKQKKIPEDSIKKLLTAIGTKGSNEDKIKKLDKLLQNKEGLEEMKQLIKYSKDFNADFELDLGLARGLSYYTGTVFEVKLKEGKITSSVAGGGRYDKIIGQFIESKQEYPAVGISFGIDRIYDTTTLENRQTISDVFVIPINTLSKSIKIVQKLRAEGIKAEIDLLGRNIGKNLDYANTQGIPFVIFAGEKELKAKKLKLKDMKSGKEQLSDLDSIIKTIKKSLTYSP